MHIVEVFGRIFISYLFLLKPVKNFLTRCQHDVYVRSWCTSISFYPSIAFEIILPASFNPGYKTKIK